MLFIAEFERAAKAKNIAVYRFLISILVPELKGLKIVVSDQNVFKNSVEINIKSNNICDVICWTCWWDEEMNRQ